MLEEMEEGFELGGPKLRQVAAATLYDAGGEILRQPIAELGFPTAFGFVPWGHCIANVNAIDGLVKTPEENPTIGLLICKDKDQTEVQWAFRGISTPMGVATYGNVGIEDIQRHLQTDG